MLPVVSDYTEFLPYLLKNEPCIFPTALIASWPACQRWRTAEGEIDIEHFKRSYGSQIVSVVDCETSERTEEPLLEVLDAWNGPKQLYIKDWHLHKASPGFYSTPDVFLDDWMNASSIDDDFRFVYMGKANTYTPVHCDVYTSYSWSSNVVGKKLWYLFPPSVCQYLRRFPAIRTSDMVHDVRKVEENVFRDFEKAWKEVLIVEQQEGETIFVPSGWFHQVINLTDCISINHNWCKSTNICSMYDALCLRIDDVESALSDTKEILQQTPGWEREWHEIVQNVLKADSGWNWIIFWKMIKVVLQRMIEPDPTHEWHCPPELRPPPDYIISQITHILKQMRGRTDDLQYIEGLSETIEQVSFLVSKL